MIKAEVIFDGDEIHCNGKTVKMDWFHEELTTWDGKTFYNVEQAIQYCLSDGEGR